MMDMNDHNQRAKGTACYSSRRANGVADGLATLFDQITEDVTAHDSKPA